MRRRVRPHPDVGCESREKEEGLSSRAEGQYADTSSVSDGIAKVYSINSVHLAIAKVYIYIERERDREGGR